MASTLSSKLSKIVQVAWSKIAVNGLATGTSKFIDEHKGFSKFYSRSGKPSAPKKVVTSIEPWLYYPPDNPYSNGIFMKTPGKYTGEMRKVVQALIANGAYIQYEYGVDLCHGVYTATDGVKWIIQVALDGIVAAQMPLTKHTSQNDWLGYSPEGTETPIEEWDGYVVLAAADDLQDFYDKTPLFPACGWAFNSSGSQAVNTCYVEGYGGPYGTPSVGYLYQLDISESNGVPSNASLSLVESGSYALLRERGLKHPNDTDDALELNMSGHENGQESIGDFSAPRYAFFDDTKLIVVRSVGDSSGDTADGKVVDSLPQPWVEHDLLYGGVTPCGFPAEQEAMILDENNLGTYHVNLDGSPVNQSGTIVDGYQLLPTIEGRSIRCEFTATKHEWTGMFGAYVTGFPVMCQRNVSYISVDGIHSITFIIIPLGDREAVYQYHDKLKTGGCGALADDVLVGDGEAPLNNCGFKLYQYVITKQPTGLFSSTATPGSFVDRFTEYLPTGVCEPIHTTNDAPCNHNGYAAAFTGNDGGTRTQNLYLVSSGGINENVWSNSYVPAAGEWTDMTNAYNDDTDPNNPQWMYVHRDNTKNNISFGAKVMNAVNGNEAYVIGVDQVKYPITTLTSSISINCFWVGDPHCVKGNCDN